MRPYRHFTKKPVDQFLERGLFYGMESSLNDLRYQINQKKDVRTPDVVDYSEDMSDPIIVYGPYRSGKTSLIIQAVRDCWSGDKRPHILIIPSSISKLKENVRDWIEIIYKKEINTRETLGQLKAEPGLVHYLACILESMDDNEIISLLIEWFRCEKLDNLVIIFSDVETENSLLKELRAFLPERYIYIEERRTPTEEEADLYGVDVFALNLSDAEMYICGDHQKIIEKEFARPAYIETTGVEQKVICDLFILQAGTLIGTLQKILSEWNDRLDCLRRRRPSNLNWTHDNFLAWLDRKEKKNCYQNHFDEWWKSLPEDVQNDAERLFTQNGDEVSICEGCLRYQQCQNSVKASKNLDGCVQIQDLLVYGVIFQKSENPVVYRIPNLLKRWWNTRVSDPEETTTMQPNEIDPEDFLSSGSEYETLRTILKAYAKFKQNADSRCSLLKRAGINRFIFKNISHEQHYPDWAISMSNALIESTDWLWDDGIDIKTYPHPLERILTELKNDYSFEDHDWNSPAEEKFVTQILEKAERNRHILKVRQAVGRIETHDGRAIGTGVYLGNNYLLTCYHVVEEIAEGPAFVRFNNRTNSQNERKYSLILPPVTTSATEELDYALIKLNERVDGIHPVTIRSTSLTNNDRIRVIHYPFGGDVRVHDGTITRESENKRIGHNFPTESGSSGAPIFDKDWKLVAIHTGPQSRDQTHAVVIKSFLEKIVKSLKM